MSKSYDWKITKQHLAVGQQLAALVVDVREFGVFLDLGEGLAPGFMVFPEVSGQPLSKGSEHWPVVGQSVRVEVLQFDDSNQQVRVSRRRVLGTR